MVDAEQGTTFADLLNHAMRQREMTLSDVRDALAAIGHPVSLASLSYWRSGAREPERRRSLEAVPELERLLGLEAGALTLRLRALHPSSAPHAFDQLLGRPTEAELLGEDDVDRVLFHLVADVGTQQEIIRARVTQAFVARRSDVEGVTIFVGPDATDEPNDVELRPVSGCTIGEFTDRERGIRSTRLTFERPLLQGESVVTEYEVVPAHGLDLETDYGLVAEQRLEEAMVWIRFDPACLPQRAWVWFDEGDLRHEWPVDLAGSSGLHYRQVGFGPGSLGARWEW